MKIKWKIIIDTFLSSLGLVTIVGSVGGAYYFGYQSGSQATLASYQNILDDYIQDLEKKASSTSYIVVPTAKPASTKPPALIPKPAWGGPELWNAVNEARVANGVNPLKQKDELCTIASIRLNEILEIGKLDAHEGFSSLPERRPDLKWIFEKYSISEFLVSGASTAQEAVELWLNTLGHKKLLTGGEYVWGCTYAQSGFGVGIAGFE